MCDAVVAGPDRTRAAREVAAVGCFHLDHLGTRVGSHIEANGPARKFSTASTRTPASGLAEAH